MFTLSTSIPELLLRVVIVYVFVFVLLRLVGKKHVGEMAPFDLVVLLLLSERVQNALVGDEKSVTGGLVAAAALFGVTQMIGYASWRWKKAERCLEGTPRALVRHGHVFKDVLSREQITHSELLEALRREGCTSLGKVRYAFLENDGTITVGLRARRPESSSPDGGPNIVAVVSPAAGSTPIYLYRKPVDLRLGADRLMDLVGEPVRHDPSRHSLFYFINKQHTRIKVLFRQHSELCVRQKPIDAERFRWPSDAEGRMVKLTDEHVEWLLEGVDVRRQHALNGGRQETQRE